MFHPMVFGFLGGFDSIDLLLLKIVDAVADPLHVLLTGGHHVGHHRGTTRAVYHEEIRKAGHRHA